MDFYIDEKDKELGRARLSQGGEGASAGGEGGGKMARPLLFGRRDSKYCIDIDIESKSSRFCSGLPQSSFLSLSIKI